MAKEIQICHLKMLSFFLQNKKFSFEQITCIGVVTLPPCPFPARMVSGCRRELDPGAGLCGPLDFSSSLGMSLIPLVTGHPVVSCCQSPLGSAGMIQDRCFISCSFSFEMLSFPPAGLLLPTLPLPVPFTPPRHSLSSVLSQWMSLM